MHEYVAKTYYKMLTACRRRSSCLFWRLQLPLLKPWSPFPMIPSQTANYRVHHMTNHKQPISFHNQARVFSSKTLPLNNALFAGFLRSLASAFDLKTLLLQEEHHVRRKWQISTIWLRAWLKPQTDFAKQTEPCPWVRPVWFRTKNTPCQFSHHVQNLEKFPNFMT